jgi:hypothetical protein
MGNVQFESYFFGGARKNHIVYVVDRSGKEGLTLSFGDASGHLQVKRDGGKLLRTSRNPEPIVETLFRVIALDDKYRGDIVEKLSPAALSMWNVMVSHPKID